MVWSEPSVKVIADSVSAIDGSRLVTVEMRHHRFILSELNTHGSAKNSSSSRAVPTTKMLAGLLTDVAMPVEFGTLQPGMQAGPPLVGQQLLDAELVWVRGALRAAQTTLELLLSPGLVRSELRRHGVGSLEELAGVSVGFIGASMQDWLDRRDVVLSAIVEMVQAGDVNPDGLLRVHKQIANRPLEPFMWHTSVHTAVFDGADVSSWVNFMAQRCTPLDGAPVLAQPEFAVVADRVRDAIAGSVPVLVEAGGWHLPYLDGADEGRPLLGRLASSVARVARTSYLRQGAGSELVDDFRLFGRLFNAEPPHWSPFEHVASPSAVWVPGRFRTWLSLRHSDAVLREEIAGHAARELKLAEAA